MHGSMVSAVRMSSSLCHLTFSILMFYPSLLLLFFDGHFETIPDIDVLIDVSVHTILPNFPDLNVQFKRIPRSGEGVSASSNPVSVLTKPTVARAHPSSAAVTTVLVLVVTCLWRWHKLWNRQRSHTLQ